MVFGLTKKEHRVPDLSRYDYYYRDKQNGERNAQLSAAAAYAASTGLATHGATGRSQQPGRAQSMTHSAGYQSAQYKNRVPDRVLSVGAMNSSRNSGVVPNYRTYSLRSQSSGQPGQGRTSSIASSNKYNRRNLPVSVNSNPSNGSRANSITVKTTEVKDPHGRTQSITKRTIKRVNGYEYVETTTTTTQAIPLVDSNRHFDEFSGNFILQENGLDELSEEDDSHSTAPAVGHAYAALTEPRNSSQYDAELQLSDGEVPLDQTSSISAFSDALEYPPGERKRNGKKTIRNKVQRSAAPKKKADSHLKKKRATQSHPMTEQEMYNKALAVAQQKVYSQSNYSGNIPVEKNNRMSTLGQRNLREEPRVTGKAPTTGENSRRGSKKISGFFNKNNKGDDSPIEKPSPAVKAITELNNSSSRLIADDEMYAQALAIAQNKYNKQHAIETVPSVQVEDNLSQPHARVPQKHAQATQTKPPTQSTQNLPGVQSMREDRQDLAEKLSGASHETNDNSRNLSIEEQDSQVFETQNGTTATKTTTASDVLQVQEPISVTETLKKNESGERKSKLKNVFDKIKQFSAENSGYQPPKREKQLASANSPSAAAPTPSGQRSSFQRTTVPEIGQQASTHAIGQENENMANNSAENGSGLSKQKGKKNFISKLFNRS